MSIVFAIQIIPQGFFKYCTLLQYQRKLSDQDCAELIRWQSENTCKLSFHWLVKIEGDMSTCLWYEEQERRLPGN